jgi:hypothetical protein
VGGGQVISPDTLLTVTVPPGAVPADTDFTIVEVTNTAPGGVGTAYRLGPAGLTLAAPVTLLFQVPDTVTAPVNDLTVATQPDTGQATAFWVRVPAVNRDGTARTLATAVDHFSDWALVTSSTTRDLNGPIQVTSTLDLPFSANGWATLNHAGGDASITYYVAGGALTVQQPVAVAGGTCTSTAPTWTLYPNVATFEPSPVTFEYGLSGLWDLACVDGTGGPLPGDSAAFALDTLGVSHYECTQGYLGSPILTPDQVVATYRVDCGAKGWLEAAWDLVSCTPGTACTTNPNACVVGTTSCATGRPVCADSTTPNANGTTCGTNLVCNAGVCNPCTAGLACTTNPNACVDGVTSCATGVETCLDTTTPKANGTTCGSDQVCNGGACSACIAGGACATNPSACLDGVLSCATGSQACVDTAVQKLNGTACGVDQVCSFGVCTGCVAGGACATNPNACVDGINSCATGTRTCIDTAVPKANGTACGPDQVCNGGACLACVAGGACATNPGVCLEGTFSCATGAQACVDTAAPRAAGLTCGADQVCNGTGTCVACVAGAACQNPTSCFTGATSCSTGAQVCVDGTTPRQAGDSCGTGFVCDGTGSCNACVAGLPCQNPASCYTGLTSCATGAQACADTTTPRPAGDACGTDQVCDGAGACNVCVAGGACTGNPNVCVSGVFSCATGSQVCLDGTTPIDGGACGAGGTCAGGVCVPP